MQSKIEIYSKFISWQITLVVACAFFTTHNFSSVYGKPVLEKTESFDLDWGNLRIRFSGESKPEDQKESFVDLEKKAWNHGLISIRDAVQDYHQEHLLAMNVDEAVAKQSALSAGKRIASSTYSYKNEYFSNGAVVVRLENSLARALQRQDVIFEKDKADDISKSQFSGLVLRSDSYVKPRGDYIIEDETGRVLFELKDVAKDAYDKNLMGRWFVNPSRSELTRIVGAKPVSLVMKQSPDKEGHFVVQGFSWKEALKDSQAILSNARIVVALPQENKRL